ncbi:MAG: multicopper oxidase domain-containing protein [Nitrosomonas sp.]|uniref:multicopper oxidase domain-containing protein n=1 Tax=Nitrosomonas sp. TaxID=42353 RepID=UPI0025F880CE|nr:multicopper oxidase domain-containing protein [Nitrosomonas sp.]MBY0475167.1 multicopper oxidase domain-containing protein [Nitrosomonas sp.]
MLFQSNRSEYDTKLIKNSNASPTITQRPLIKLCAVTIALTLTLSTFSVAFAAEHIIQLTAEETLDDGFGNKLLAYKMLSHKVNGTDITSRYSPEATIPGPTIELTEGDTVKISIQNAIPGNNTPIPGISRQVSIHVHGVHYDILSDGTLKVINKNFDEGAGAGLEETYVIYEYHWNVAAGTAGTWPYHDHNFETHNGAEHKGLFGAIIVNKIGTPNFDKDYVIYLGDDAFWGMEIDGASRTQSKHGTNPTLAATKNSNVRFHLIALGTDIHTFKLDGYKWVDPGTNNLINQVAIGPLEKHVFSVIAKNSADYKDKNFSNNLLGMKGKFRVQ